MLMITKEELIKLGYKPNPNCYLGDGQLYCSVCKRYTLHTVMSKFNEDFEICTFCNNSNR